MVESSYFIIFLGCLKVKPPMFANFHRPRRIPADELIVWINPYHQYHQYYQYHKHQPNIGEIPHFFGLKSANFGWNLETSVGHHIPGRLAPRIQRIHIIHPSFNPSFPLKSDSKSCYLTIILSFNPIFNPSSSLNFGYDSNSPLFIDEPSQFPLVQKQISSNFHVKNPPASSKTSTFA